MEQENNNTMNITYITGFRPFSSILKGSSWLGIALIDPIEGWNEKPIFIGDRFSTHPNGKFWSTWVPENGQIMYLPSEVGEEPEKVVTINSGSGKKLLAVKQTLVKPYIPR